MQRGQWWKRMALGIGTGLPGVAAAVVVALGLSASAMADDESSVRFADAKSLGVAPYSQARPADPMSEIAFRPRPARPSGVTAQPIGPGQVPLDPPSLPSFSPPVVDQPYPSPPLFGQPSPMNLNQPSSQTGPMAWGQPAALPAAMPAAGPATMSAPATSLELVPRRPMPTQTMPSTANSPTAALPAGMGQYAAPRSEFRPEPCQASRNASFGVPASGEDTAAFTVLGDSPPRTGEMASFGPSASAAIPAEDLRSGRSPVAHGSSQGGANPGGASASVGKSDDAAYAFLGDDPGFLPSVRKASSSSNGTDVSVNPNTTTDAAQPRPASPSAQPSPFALDSHSPEKALESEPKTEPKAELAQSPAVQKIQLVVNDPAAQRAGASRGESRQGPSQVAFRSTGEASSAPTARAATHHAAISPAAISPSANGDPMARQADLARRQMVSRAALASRSAPATWNANRPARPLATGEQTPQAAPRMRLAQPAAAVLPLEEPRAVSPIAPGVRLAQATVPAAAPPQQVGPFEIVDHSDELHVILHRSKLLRTKVDIYRTAVVDPTICDVVQFTPREVSIIGRAQGATHVTFWFADAKHQPVTYLVRVAPDPEVQERRAKQYEVLEDILAELFPESKVRLTPVADKLIVRGQARDAAEAAQILALIRGERVRSDGRGGDLVEGRAANPLGQEETNRQPAAMNVINMLQIPGVQQVALKVKIAELNRSAARNFGVDVDMTAAFSGGSLVLQSLLNQTKNATGITAGTLIGKFDQDQLQMGIHYLESHGVIRMLSEPTLVTLSGRPASFVAGGEFAVPTTVGVGGASAVTTDFRAYGAIITFVPVVLDKDRIRLEVAPEFSKIDRTLTVGGDANGNGGTPGLSTRAVTTTVEMREGQTLAIAGLLDDTMQGSNSGEIPLVAQIFGKRAMSRNETELIILVTPELVEAMEPDEVPPLPGFDVTEPTNLEFYLKGRIEGRPTHEYRSTIWPRLRNRYQAGGPAMISGPFGHGD